MSHALAGTNVTVKCCANPLGDHYLLVSINGKQNQQFSRDLAK